MKAFFSNKKKLTKVHLHRFIIKISLKKLKLKLVFLNKKKTKAPHALICIKCTMTKVNLPANTTVFCCFFFFRKMVEIAIL